jgi:phytoene dehydrogenase-like protein
MTTQNVQAEKTTSTLILGGGLAGLMLAAKLAIAGHELILCDQHSSIGGFHSDVIVGNHKISAIAYKALGLGEKGRVTRLLSDCTGTPIQAQRMQFSDHVYFPDEDIRLPGDISSMQIVLEERFPNERTGIGVVLDTIVSIHSALQSLTPGGKSIGEPSRILRSFADKSYEEFLRENISDDRLLAVFALRLFSSANDLITMGAYLGSILNDGLYWIQDCSCFLVNTFAEPIRVASACEVETSLVATEFILDQDQQVRGVRFAGGLQIYAENIVLAFDPTQALQLLPSSREKIYLEQAIDAKRRSLSSLIFICVMQPCFRKRLDQHFGTARLHVCSEDKIFDTYRYRESGCRDLSLAKVTWEIHESKTDGRNVSQPLIYIEVDEMLSPEAERSGEPNSTVSEHETKQAFIKILETVFPSAGSEIEACRLLTPFELERLARSTGGSCSGWIGDGGTGLLDRAFLKSNLSLVGQWSRYGTGLPMLEQSAEVVSRRILSKGSSRTAT